MALIVPEPVQSLSDRPVGPWDDRTERRSAPSANGALGSKRRIAWAGPGQIALLWLTLSLLNVADTFFFWDQMMVDKTLLLAGMPVLAGLLAGWALRLRASALRLIATFQAIAIGSTILWIGIECRFAGFAPPMMVMVAIVAWLIAASAVIWRVHRARPIKWRATAILLLCATSCLPWSVSQANVSFWRASTATRVWLHLARPETANSDDPTPGIAPDRLWGAQPGLLNQASAALPPRLPDRVNLYAIAIAAGGGQQLFAREAHLALEVAAARFGSADRGGVLLSNGAADMLHTPLATRDGIAAVTAAIGKRIDPARDIVFVYLASHGSRQAELETDLPDDTALTPISAPSMAAALKRAGIRRRIVIVSACYAGTWIPALANDDTIVITAARRDRTSFGCDDTRSLTYFGEAFLHGPLAGGASFRDAFAAARVAIAGWEKREKLTPSEPQAFVGRHMQPLWTERRPS